MGGGDLNLKKSWHPSTLRNIERVWKAEQKHEAEQKKIEQLQRELADERARDEIRHYAEEKGVVKKKDDRLDWMYQGPAALVDREQYLTGRTLDKTFDILEQMENKNQTYETSTDQPGAIFSQPTVNVTVDLANKIREDPLFSIRKRETDQKKQLLNNPVKMKQLRELLEQSVGSLDKKSKKKKKKDKKRKKRKAESDSSEDESARKRSKREREKEKNSKTRREDSREKFKERDVVHTDNVKDKYYRNGKEYGLIGGKKAQPNDFRSERKRSRSPRERANKQPVLKHWNDSKQKESRPKSPPRWQRNEPKKKLDPEEAERKRREMMDDAKWRQEQRERNVRKYREEEEREDFLAKQAMAKQKNETPDFIKPLLSKAADSGSVESRVKQKMYNIQRNRSAMDQNFAKR